MEYNFLYTDMWISVKIYMKSLFVTYAIFIVIVKLFCVGEGFGKGTLALFAICQIQYLPK